MNDKEKQLAISKAKAELTRLKHLVAQKYGELIGENLTIFKDILDLINRLDKITKDLGLDTGFVNQNDQHHHHKTTYDPKVDPTLQQGLNFADIYEILYTTMNLPVDQKQVLKHMVDYVNENKDITDEKVKKLVDTYKKSIDAICDLD